MTTIKTVSETPMASAQVRLYKNEGKMKSSSIISWLLLNAFSILVNSYFRDTYLPYSIQMKVKRSTSHIIRTRTTKDDKEDCNPNSKIYCNQNNQ